MEKYKKINSKKSETQKYQKIREKSEKKQLGQVCFPHFVKQKLNFSLLSTVAYILWSHHGHMIHNLSGLQNHF